MATFYLDTNALFKFYGFEPSGSASSDELALVQKRLIATLKGQTVYITRYTEIEFANVLLKYYRKNLLTRKALTGILDRLHGDIARADRLPKPFKRFEMPDHHSHLERAEELLLFYGKRFQFGSLDAIHIAIAEALSQQHADLHFISADKGIVNVCAALGLAIFNPE